jgi:hypothetical protein
MRKETINVKNPPFMFNTPTPRFVNLVANDGTELELFQDGERVEAGPNIRALLINYPGTYHLVEKAQ